MSVQIWEIILAVVVPLIAWGVRALSKMGWAGAHEAQLAESVVFAVQRVKDKFLNELEGAKDPTSPGGVEVTDAELSQAREKAFGIVMASLKGPALEYAQGRGVDIVKGMVGKAIDKWVTKKPKGES